MRIEFEEINNGWLVHIKVGSFGNNEPVFFKTRGQAIAYAKNKLNNWRC